MERRELTRRDIAGALVVGAVILALALGRLAADPKFFWRDDLQTGVSAMALEIGRAVAEGSWPLLSRNSWNTAAFAGEMQCGVFSPVLLACDYLVYLFGVSLPMVTAALVIVHLINASIGAYLLGRDHRLPWALAAVVAFVASLNGWIVMWAATSWFSMLSSFSWLPWYWLGMRRMARSSRPLPVAATAVVLYLLIACGWPGTVAMAGVIGVWFAIQLIARRDWHALGRIVAANAFGFALAAPVLLVTSEYLPTTARTEMELVQRAWLVPLSAVVAMVLPTLRTIWHGWHGDALPHTGIEMAGGLVPLIGVVGASLALGRRWIRECRFELSLALTALLLSMLPSVWVFRWSFRWLPLFHLPFAIAGAAGIAALLESRGKPPRWEVTIRHSRGTAVIASHHPSIWMAILLVVSVVYAGAYDEQAHTTGHLALIMLIALAGWIYADFFGSSDYRAAFPLLVCVWSLVTAYSSVPVNRELPNWQMSDVLRQPIPFRHDRTYMAVYSWSDIMDQRRQRNEIELRDPLFRPGNLPMAADLDFISGYSSLRPWGLHALFGTMEGHGALKSTDRLLRIETQPGALFDHMSVEGLVFDREALSRAGLQSIPGWRTIAEFDRDVLVERVGRSVPDVYFASGAMGFPSRDAAACYIVSRDRPAFPVVVLGSGVDSCRQARVLRSVRMRMRSSADVDTSACDGAALLVFARPWVIGFRATIDGAEVPVDIADLMMPAIRVPPHTKAHIELYYRPRSLVTGFWIAGFAAAALLVYITVRWS